MTADEFRKILDRFHIALVESGYWSATTRKPIPLDDDTPQWAYDLEEIWCDLNRHCALMKDAERRIVISGPPLEEDVAVILGATNQQIEKRLAICGETFCETCGDCLACYDCDPCIDGQTHVWPTPETRAARNAETLAMFAKIQRQTREEQKVDIAALHH